jgi:EmrB/QacA subfamily drug resistance transporter
MTTRAVAEPRVASGRAPEAGARRWWTLGIVCTAIFMLLIDITIVNVALPAVQSDLGAGFTELQWVIDAYSLSLAALVLNAGSVADLAGRRKVFVAGVAAFTLASLACGLATSAVWLIVARAAQGVGGAVMFATSLALITQEFEGRERGTAFGIWGATTGAAVAIGPLAGGALTEIDWRFIFFVNVPIGIALIVLSALRLREERDPERGGLDLPGLLTLSGALFLLVFALLRGNDWGWLGPRTLGMLIGAVVLGCAFVVVEARSRQPMLELGMFRTPTFTGAQVAAFTISFAAFSSILYITLWLQNVQGLSPLQAGLRFLTFSLPAALVAPLAGRLSTVVAPRLLICGGLAATGAGLLLMRGIDAGSDWTALLAGFIVVGAGVGLVNPPLASTAIATVREERSGTASGTNNTFRQVGIATGIAALGAVFQDRVSGAVDAAVRGTRLASRAPEIAAGASSGSARPPGGVPPRVASRIGAAVREGFASGLDRIFLIAAVVAFLGAIASLALVRGRDIRAPGQKGR